MTTALRGHGVGRRLPFLWTLTGAIVNRLRPDVAEADGHTRHLQPRERPDTATNLYCVMPGEGAPL